MNRRKASFSLCRHFARKTLFDCAGLAIQSLPAAENADCAPQWPRKCFQDPATPAGLSAKRVDAGDFPNEN